MPDEKTGITEMDDCELIAEWADRRWRVAIDYKNQERQREYDAIAAEYRRRIDGR